MRKCLYSIYGLLLVAAFASCKRDIDLHIKRPKNDSLVVIEGNMTNLLGVQIVTLSFAVPYNSTNIFPPVTGAVVNLSSDDFSYNLTEEPPGRYTMANLQGKVGQTYKLTVTKGGDTVYTATSVMPKPVKLDSIGVSAIAVGNKIVRTISAFYNDPPDEKNQYRFVLYINGVQVKQVFVMDDTYTNGRIVNTMLYQNDITLKSGDRADVEMQCIDAPVYNYWYTLSKQDDDTPSNSATPSNPESNLSNGALGYFSAHTAERKSLIIP